MRWKRRNEGRKDGMKKRRKKRRKKGRKNGRNEKKEEKKEERETGALRRVGVWALGRTRGLLHWEFRGGEGETGDEISARKKEEQPKERRGGAKLWRSKY